MKTSPISILLLLATILHSGLTFSAPQSTTPTTNNQAKLIIDDIVCRGNDTTECTFVTNKYFQVVGDELDPEEIADAKLRLGTLIQFQSVAIYLEKGKKRNHVVVVFDVTEASNLFYEVGLTALKTTLTNGGYDPSQFRRDDQSGNLTAKVTNFNFLGSAKELSFAVTTNRETSDTSFTGLGSRVNLDTFDIENFRSNNWQQNRNNNVSVNLRYFDPHLLNTSHYYMAMDAQYSRLDSKFNSREQFITPENKPDMVFNSKADSSWQRYSLLFGKRFARYSFVAFDVAYSDTRYSGSDTVYGVSLGWNSEDDVLLPTKGSSLSTRLSRTKDSWTGSMDFKQNLAIRANKIVTFGGGVTYNSLDSNCNSCALLIDDSISASAFTRYTDITPIDVGAGIYSSWFVNARYGQSNISEDLYNTRYYDLSAGYTYQTASIIYRFTLSYSNQENH